MQLRQVAAKRSAGGKVEIVIPRLTARQEAQAAARGLLRRGHADAVAALVLSVASVRNEAPAPARGTLRILSQWCLDGGSTSLVPERHRVTRRVHMRPNQSFWSRYFGAFERAARLQSLAAA